MGRQIRSRGFAARLTLLAALTVIPASASFAQAPPAPPPAAEQQPTQNPALAQFREVLERSGSIASHPRYGEVWLPGSVPEGWSPYPPCRWSFDRQRNAWNYEDPTDWGAIVHHHGRWAFDQHYGWMWVAEATYGPGWVHWTNEGGSVRWAALAPEMDAQPVPTTGWHSQDQQTFNAGCRASSPPPPPTAYRPPPVPAYGAPVYSGPPPIYPAGPPPVYVERPPVYVPGPPPFTGRPFGPPPIVVVLPGSHCQRFPNSPACRGAGPGPVRDPICSRVPNHPRCREQGAGAGPVRDPICSRVPNHPRCRITGPGKQTFAANRRHFASPFQRPRGMKPTFGMRPGSGMRPIHVAGGHRPHQRPQAARPRPVGGFGGGGGFGRPGGIARPMGRPAIMSRPAMRPHAGGGGGHHRRR